MADLNDGIAHIISYNLHQGHRDFVASLEKGGFELPEGCPRPGAGAFDIAEFFKALKIDTSVKNEIRAAIVAGVAGAEKTAYAPGEIAGIFAEHKTAGAAAPVEEMLHLFRKAPSQKKVRKASEAFLAGDVSAMPEIEIGYQIDTNAIDSEIIARFEAIVKTVFRAVSDPLSDAGFLVFAKALSSAMENLSVAKPSITPEGFSVKPLVVPQVSQASDGGRPAPRTRPVRPKRFQDLLIDPHPPKDDMGAMTEWISGQPWGTYSIGMDYPESVLTGDDVMREQSRYTGDPDSFIRSLEAGDRYVHASNALESGVAEAILRAFPPDQARVEDALVLQHAEAAFLKALAKIDGPRYETILAAQGQPILSPGAMDLCKSMITAMGRFTDLVGDAEWVDNSEIPGGDFGPFDALSVPAVLGRAFFAHMCGRPMDDAVCDTLASLIVRMKYPGNEEIFSDEAFTLGGDFAKDPEAAMGALETSTLEVPEVSM